MADSLPTREDVMAAYGEAMLAVQQFEEAMVGLLGASGEVDAAQSDDVMTNLSRPGAVKARRLSSAVRRLVVGFSELPPSCRAC